MIATIALVSGLRSRLCVNNNDLPAASGLVWAASRHSVFVFIHRNYKMLNDVFCLTFMTSSSPVVSRWLQGLWVSLEMILLTSRKKSELPHGSPDKIYQVTGEKWADINNVMGRGLFFHCFFAWPRFLVFIIPGQSGPITRKTRISTILVLVQILSDLAPFSGKCGYLGREIQNTCCNQSLITSPSSWLDSRHQRYQYLIGIFRANGPQLLRCLYNFITMEMEVKWKSTVIKSLMSRCEVTIKRYRILQGCQTIGISVEGKLNYLLEFWGCSELSAQQPALGYLKTCSSLSGSEIQDKIPRKVSLQIRPQDCWRIIYPIVFL